MRVSMMVSATTIVTAMGTLSGGLQVEIVGVLEVIMDMVMVAMVVTVQSRCVEFGFLEAIKGILLSWHMLILTYREVRAHSEHVENLRRVHFTRRRGRGSREHRLPILLEVMAFEVIRYILLTVCSMRLV